MVQLAVEVLVTEDLVDFDKLHTAYFGEEYPLPGIKNIASARVVKDDNGKIVASGFVKLLTEAIIVTDLKSDKITRVRALDLLTSELVQWCHEHEVEQIHAFVSSKFGRILYRRYGFGYTKGVAMVMDLG